MKVLVYGNMPEDFYKLLKSNQCEIIQNPSQKSLKEILRDLLPDVIFLTQGVINEYELFLQKPGDLMSVPVVLINNDLDSIKGFHGIFDDILTLPIDIKLLKNRLMLWKRMKTLREQLKARRGLTEKFLRGDISRDRFRNKIPQILLVEDSATDRMVLSKYLEKENFVLTAVPSAEDALVQIKTNSFDVVILDIILPNLDGYEVLKYLKSNDVTCHIPVLVVSGLSSVDDRIRSLEYGADDFLTKPINGKELIIKINTLLAKKRQYDALLYEYTLVEQRAVRDGLTGLYNHSYFKDFLHAEFMRSKENGLYLSLIMIDIDIFKEYNDRYGHLAGDKLIVTVGNVLQRHTRAYDLVARYGGDEFAVLLPETPKDLAYKVAERILLCMKNEKKNVKPELTFSIGLATFPGDAASPEELFKVADARLYQAKKDGRNRIRS